MRHFLSILLLGFLTFADQPDAEKKMNAIGEQYVKLVLAVGQHDPDFVDAYYGPQEWMAEAKQKKRSLDAIASNVEDLLKQLETVTGPIDDEVLRFRRIYFQKQLTAVKARVTQLSGKKLSFDEESKLLYDVVAPHHPVQHFQETLRQLDKLLPGEGDLLTRLDQFKKEFIIPVEQLDTVFQAAIAECRARTKKQIALPEKESFVVEYVKNKSWSGYNWYKGNSHSVIQVNTDFPIHIDRAIDLAGHEGYPGHHVYNVLLEKNLLRDRGWIEFSVYALFSPQSLIAEGSANYGVQMLFPTIEERIEYEKKHLFPLAGLDPSKAEKFYRVHELTEKLEYADNEAARLLLDQGKREEAYTWLTKYNLRSPDKAKQRLDFIEKYRSYVINYNLGEDLVARYLEANSKNRAARWKVFERLISVPMVASELQ